VPGDKRGVVLESVWLPARLGSGATQTGGRLLRVVQQVQPRAGQPSMSVRSTSCGSVALLSRPNAATVVRSLSTSLWRSTASSASRFTAWKPRALLFVMSRHLTCMHAFMQFRVISRHFFQQFLSQEVSSRSMAECFQPSIPGDYGTDVMTQRGTSELPYYSPESSWLSV
jgi:hypothetical protein